MVSVLCLRSEADFARVDALPPASLAVSYLDPNDPSLPQRMKEAHALVIPAVGAKLPPALFEGTSLKLVQVTGAGLDRLDRETMIRLKIPVANVLGNNAVAEYAVMVATLLRRRLIWADVEIKKGNYAAFRARMLSENLSGLEGLTVGIIGLGVIGLGVAEAFHRVCCRICYYDPAPQNLQAAAALDATPLALAELLKTADIVSLHVPLLDSTRGLIGARELAAMKRDAVLIQAARGGVVDEAALVAQLKSGHLGGAAVDVY